MQTNTKYTKSKTNLAMVVKIPNWPGVERGIMLVRANPAIVRFPNCIVYSWVYNTQKTVKFDFDCFHSLH